jgi:integrase
LKFRRQRFQRGTLRKVVRANNQWAWEYRYQDPLSGNRKSMFLSTEKFPTRVAVERHLEAFVLKLNSENPALAILEPTFDALLDRFIEDERLLEIKRLRPGDQSAVDGGLSYATVTSYLSVIKRVRTKWGGTRLTRIKPIQVQEWLRQMDAAPKTKGHVKALKHRLYEKAMLWELVEWQRNPMQLVEVKGISKRRRKPIVLTVEQYCQILALIPEPYRTMVAVAQCTGLRAEEVLALEWGDIDFENLHMRIVRAVVHGRVKWVKTEYSEDELPLTIPTSRRFSCNAGGSGKSRFERPYPRECLGNRSPTWSFRAPPQGVTTTRLPSSRTTSVPQGGVWWNARSGAQAGGLVSGNQPDAKRQAPAHPRGTSGSSREVRRAGWHTFRHTYRSWLDDTGAPIGVQQKLMRHAQISTTMNVYGNALMTAKREANSRVVRMALRNS